MSFLWSPAFSYAEVSFYVEAPGLEESVEAVRSHHFVALTRDYRHPYSDAAIWLRTDRRNASDQRIWQLILDESTLNRVDLYIFDGDQLLAHEQSGSLVPSHLQNLHRRQPRFRFDWPLGSERTFFLRLKSFNIIDPTLRLEPEAWIAGREDSEALLLGAYYGGVLSLILFNLLLYQSTRDRSYLYYALFALATSFTYFTFDGLADVFLGHFTQGWQRYLNTSCASALVAAVVFAREFLQTPQTAPRFDRWLRVLGVANVAVALLSLSSWNVASGYAVDALTLATGSSGVWAGFLAFRAGHRPARYYLFSWVVLLALAVVWMTAMYGGLPRNTFTVHCILIGSFLELVVMSLGLGARLKQAQAAEAVARAAQMLAHDLRKPFSLLDSALTAIASSPKADVANIALKRTEQVRTAAAYVGTILDDLMQIGLPGRLERQSANLEDILARALLLVAPPSTVEISRDFGHLGPVLVDQAKILRVLTNIIENAVQAGARHVWVRTSLKEGSRDRLFVVVGNDGSPVPAAEREGIFRPFFTRGKAGGTGLGLAIARKIVEAHGDRIYCRQKPGGEGVEFCFTLPLARFSGELQRFAEVKSEPVHFRHAQGPIIAVVDDCPFVRDDWEISAVDAEVRTFAEPGELIACLFKDEDFHRRLAVVVTDFHFRAESAMDGHQLARQLSSTKPGRIILASDQSGLTPNVLAAFAAQVDKRPHSLSDLLPLLK